MSQSISRQRTTTPGVFQKKARSPRVVKTPPKTFRKHLPELNSKDRFAELSSKITPLLKPYVNRISVFGSYARGEVTAESDIDLLIALKPVEARPVLGLFDFIKLEQELKKKLGCEVDLVTEEGLNPRRRLNIEKDRVVLYEKK